MTRKKGFTLIEMLVVIAIIAVLVAIIIPTVTSATTKARAAADAANLRSVLGQLNTALLMDKSVEEVSQFYAAPESQYAPGAKMEILYTKPGFVRVFYVDGAKYYGLDYLADLTANGSTDQSCEKPSMAGDWYQVGVGKPESK